MNRASASPAAITNSGVQLPLASITSCASGRASRMACKQSSGACAFNLSLSRLRSGTSWAHRAMASGSSSDNVNSVFSGVRVIPVSALIPPAICLSPIISKANLVQIKVPFCTGTADGCLAALRRSRHSPPQTQAHFVWVTLYHWPISV